MIGDQVTRTGELPDSVAHDIFIVGLMLQVTAYLPRDAAAQCITEVLGRLDNVVRKSAIRCLPTVARVWTGRAWRPPPDVLGRATLARNRSALLRPALAAQ